MELGGIRSRTALGPAQKLRQGISSYLMMRDDLCMGSCLAEAIMGGM
jgi:hypothetical protein